MKGPGAAEGEFLTASHLSHDFDFVICAILTSIPGHHTWFLANALGLATYAFFCELYTTLLKLSL